MNDRSAGIRLHELRHVVAELSDEIGAPLSGVFVPTPTALVLEFPRCSWWIETFPLPRLHALRRRPKAPRSPYSFQGLLRARLDRPLDRVALLGGDRVVELGFGPWTLHLRLFGRGGGIWLVGPEGVVAASTGPAPPELPPLPSPEPDLRPPRFEPAGGEGWSQAAATFFEALAARRAEAELRTRITGHLQRERGRLERLVRNLQDDLDRTSQAATLRRRADALACVLHTVPKGATRAVAPDLDDPTLVHDVPLDPGRPPSATLASLYEKAGRLERAVGALVDRLVDVQARLDAVRADLAEAGTAPRARLEALATAWRLQAPERPQGGVGGDPWWTWEGPRGERLLVGKHAAGNHALVFRHARGRDWWAHVRGLAGAHVVVPWTRTDQPPPEHLLLAAAQIAAWSGRAAEGALVEVQLARVRDVKPVRGAGPGRVTVQHERVLVLDAPAGPPAGWRRVDA